MKLTIDFSEFEPWSGAIDAWERIEEAGKVDELEFILDDVYPDGMSDTELNDLLWFEPETVFNCLGMDTEDDEEEDDEEEDSDNENFDNFCSHFSSCAYCPLRAEISVSDCIKRLNGEEHDKLLACIKRQDKDNYNASILDD